MMLMMMTINYLKFTDALNYFILFHTSEMTSLAEGVKRSEMICMLAVPAKMTCIDLMQFVAPSE